MNKHSQKFVLYTFGYQLLTNKVRADDAVYDFTRLESLGDNEWSVYVYAAGLLALLAYVWLVYRREARTVSMTKAMLLAALRTVAIAGLVAFFLGLEKRSSSEVVEPSRVAVLVDTSLSMKLPSDAAGAADDSSRAGRVLALVTASPLIQDLNAQHEVDIVAFDETARPLVYLPQLNPNATTPPSSNQKSPQPDPLAVDRLAQDLEPTGHETHLGHAIAATLERYRGLPLAGIVLLTDGGQNAGLELPPAGEAASTAAVRIHSIGFGPLTAPANLAIQELIAPERAYPGDKLTLQAVVHSQGAPARQVDLQLFRRPAVEPDTPWELIDSQQIATTSDDQLDTIRFETSPAEAGEYIYEVRVGALPHESQKGDNAAQAEVAVVERKTRVLLYAGGPARDYRYLRNQLRRDKSFTVDVLLQTAVEGASQDADNILYEFPTSAQQLSEYDAIVAFDPDWSLLATDQVRWLEQWIARQAGGLVVIPGRVNTPQWGIDSRLRTIRGLYPVRLPDRLLDLRNDTSANETARPLIFTRAGSEAEFLWLADSGKESSAAWRQFAGVFGPFEHLGPKPGATVYAHLAGSGDEPGPAYFCSQYYGAGQVFYMGSSELWRLRALDTNYSERLWTQLLRHVSQGRLLQGSPRGKLLVSQDRYEVGATVPLRAVMSDQQLEPLVAESLPLTVEMPNGRVEKLTLTAESSRTGNFAGELRVVEPGVYRFVLPVPDSSDELTRTIHVSAPQLEIRQTVRNESALRGLAKQTGGYYYDAPSVALSGSDGAPSIAKATPSQARTKRVLGALDEDFARSQSYTLLAIVAGALCLEWIIRRLSFLA